MGEKLLVYIAGPFRADTRAGIEANIARADEYALMVHGLGHVPVCTHTMTGRWVGKVDDDGDEFIKHQCLPILRRCDAILMIPGWPGSRGARVEHREAMRQGLQVFLDAGEIPRPGQGSESILRKAERLVAGPRQSDYDHPKRDFRRQAMVWTALLDEKLKVPLTPGDIANCMMGVKLVRESHKHKRDNLVDLAGYAQTKMMLREEDEREGGG